MTKPKRLAKKLFRVEVPLYHYTVTISFSAKHLVKIFPELDYDFMLSCGAFTTRTEDDSGADGVLVHFSDANPEYIAHEAVHAAHYCLLSRGVETDMENDEALAYLVGWFADTITQLAIKEEVYNANNS